MVSLPELHELLACLWGPSTKMKELLLDLNKWRLPELGRIQQTVVFTRFHYDTLTHIVHRLYKTLTPTCWWVLIRGREPPT